MDIIKEKLMFESSSARQHSDQRNASMVSRCSIVFLATLFVTGAVGQNSVNQGGFSEPNYIFVTSSEGVGDLSSWPLAGNHIGTAAGNSICRSEAQAIGMPAADEYIAWLSDLNVDAYCRAHGMEDTIENNCGLSELPADAGPWHRLDGQLMGGRLPSLLDPNATIRPIRFSPDLSNPGNFFEKDFRITAYTGTRETGASTGFFRTCDDWTNGDLELGTVSFFSALSNLWAGRNGGSICKSTRSLICLRPGSFSLNIEQTATNMSRRVFVTSERGTGDLSKWADVDERLFGVEAGDRICQSHARRGGLINPNQYRAWLSDGDISPIDRLDTNQPLLTMNRFVLADSPQQLLEDGPDVTFQRTENGELVRASVWTGSLNGGLPDCNGWTTDDPDDSGIFGFGPVRTSWTSMQMGRCNVLRRLYCFADYFEEIVFNSGFDQTP